MRSAEKLVLCIVGMPGSGKTTASQIIKKKFDAFVVSTGDIIREEIKRRGLAYTKENDEKTRDWFHAGRESLFISRVCERLKKSNKKILVVEGSRSAKEPQFIKNCLGKKPIVIALVVNFNIRYTRELKRGRFAAETKKYLQERDAVEKRLGLDKLIKSADYKIKNARSKKELEKELARIIEKINYN